MLSAHVWLSVLRLAKPNRRQVPQASIYYELVFCQLGGIPSSWSCVFAWKRTWKERRRTQNYRHPRRTFMTDAPLTGESLASVAVLCIVMKAKLFLKSKLTAAGWRNFSKWKPKFMFDYELCCHACLKFGCIIFPLWFPSTSVADCTVTEYGILI